MRNSYRGAKMEESAEESSEDPRGDRTKIAVGVGSSPNSARLVRWAHHAATGLRVDWIAFHVDGGVLLGGKDRERLEANLDLARKLGAQVSTIVGSDVVRALIDGAKAKSATMLVIGRSGLSHLGHFRGRATISDRILREAGPLDVVVVSDSKEVGDDFTLASIRKTFSAPFRQYGLLLLVFALATIICLVLAPVMGHRSVAFLYLAAVLFLSLVSGPGPVVLLAVLSSLAYNFFFIPPRFTFAISSPEDILLFGLYFLVAAVTGSLSAGLRSRERLLQRRDREASLLLAAAERLSELSSTRDAAAASAKLVEGYNAAPAVVYVVGDSNRQGAFFASGAENLEEIDRKAAKYCAEKSEICGEGTDRFPDSSYRFIPARVRSSAVAAIGFSCNRKRNNFQSGDDELFAAFGRSLAMFVERERSVEASRIATLELESERLAKVLFDSVSHELKTPLTTITGSLSALRDEAIGSNPSMRQELLEGALSSAGHLDEIVEDFLSIGRMESGRLKLKRNLTEARDLAEAATAAAAESLAGRRVNILLPENPCDFRLDDVLVVRLMKNLLENACRYSRKNGIVELRLMPRDNGLAITVADEGPGFGDERMRAPFVKFKRADGDAPGGLGLGLAMCRGIVEAHGGGIAARRSLGGFEVEAFFPNCQGG